MWRRGGCSRNGRGGWCGGNGVGAQTVDEVRADRRPAQLTRDRIGTSEESAFYSEHKHLILKTARSPCLVFI